MMRGEGDALPSGHQSWVRWRFGVAAHRSVNMHSNLVVRTVLPRVERPDTDVGHNTALGRMTMADA